MVPDLQTPRVTEIQVRMGCNGCVQKIKKALNGIKGIYDLYIDFPQQKLTIIGWEDTEKIVKAIKKTRKNATICSNMEPTESASPPTEPEPQPEGNAPAPDATQQPPVEAPPAQAGTPAETMKDTSLPEQPPAEATPSPSPTENKSSQQSQSTLGTKDVGEVHMIYQHLPNYINRFSSGHSYVGHRDQYHNSPVFLQELPQSVYVTHSYNTYKTSPNVTEYEYVRSPPRHTHYNRMEHYSRDYHNGNGNITSMFSDDNPNACRIVWQKVKGYL